MLSSAHPRSAAFSPARARGSVLVVALTALGDEGLLTELAKADALVVTVLAAGGRRPADVGAGGDDEAWDVQALAALAMAAGADHSRIAM